MVKFFHAENDRPLFYWVFLEAEYECNYLFEEADNFTTAVESLVAGIESVKTFIDDYKAGKSVKESDKPNIMIDQNSESKGLINSDANEIV